MTVGVEDNLERSVERQPRSVLREPAGDDETVDPVVDQLNRGVPRPATTTLGVPVEAASMTTIP